MAENTAAEDLAIFFNRSNL